MHAIDPASLALIVPILRRGLLDRTASTKVAAALIVGNMCSLISDPRDVVPYLPVLLPALKKAVVDPIPDVRATAALVIAALSAEGTSEIGGIDHLDRGYDGMQEKLQRCGADIVRVFSD